MVELYKTSEQNVVDIAKTFERRKCNHREAIDNDDCLRSVVGAFTSSTLFSSPEIPTWLAVYLTLLSRRNE